MIVLIDTDIVCYRAGFACDNEDLNIALWQTDQMIERIVLETNASDYKCFITGSDNFRYAINPEYKANRKDARRPKWLQEIREHVVLRHNASISNGREADDDLGIAQDKIGTTDKWHEGVYQTTVASIDKDLLMIPGQHYNFVKGIHKTVSEFEGKQWLYYQLVMGDRADNIFGYDGKCRDKVPKFLEETMAVLFSYETEREMYDHVLDMYDFDEERLHMNAHCLYIHQKEDDEWIMPK